MRRLNRSFALTMIPALSLVSAPGRAFTPAPPAAPAPVAAPLPSVKLPPDLDRVLRDYEAAWQRRDATALADLFAEDGFVLAQGKPPVRGRAAIREAYADAGGALSLRALAYATEGSLGYILGGFTHRSGEPDAGKFVLTLRRGAGGRWLIVSDMDNPNHPPRRLGQPETVR
jgi:ketosteroid isomerase-like protein